MKIKELNNRIDKINLLIDIWEDSVKTSHDFLNDEDIMAIKGDVKSGILAITSLYIYEDAEEILGFIGVENQKIEMLFISEKAQNRGIGKELVIFAINNLNAYYVDVNEDNKNASGFYYHLGFSKIDRSELDGQGRPFPILHLKLDK